MAWAAIGGAVAGAAVTGMMNNSGGGGGGGATQTQSKEPWAPAVPWITSNLQTGQGLQGYYQQNPFNPIQQAAYGNLFRSNDYVNNAFPGLLAQMSQTQGFDRNNPRGRPAAYSFPAMGVGPAGVNQDLSGLLGAGVMHTQNPFTNGLMPAMAPAMASTPQQQLAPQLGMPGAAFNTPDGA